MAAIACDICGGSLSMDASGDFALCDSCGMKHTKDRVKAMALEIKGTVEVSNLAGVESLMMRGNLALEDSKLGEAIGYFDKVLDINPKYAPAYVGKLCAELSQSFDTKNKYFTYEVKKESDLARYYKPLDDMPTYQKAIRFADETYRLQIESYNNEIKKRVAELEKKYSFYMVIGWECYFFSSNKTHIYYGEHSIPTIGKIKEGSFYKILRTGNEHRYESGDFLHTDYDSIKKGDVAVITNEMLKREEQERIEQEQKNEAWKREQRERQRKYEEENQREQRRIEQSKQWKQQGLCNNCGSRISGFFTKKCKNCGNEEETARARALAEWRRKFLKMILKFLDIIFIPLLIVAVIALFTSVGVGQAILITLISMVILHCSSSYYSNVKKLICLFLGFFVLIFLFSSSLLMSANGIIFLLSFFTANVICLIDD